MIVYFAVCTFKQLDTGRATDGGGTLQSEVESWSTEKRSGFKSDQNGNLHHQANCMEWDLEKRASVEKHKDEKAEVSKRAKRSEGIAASDSTLGRPLRRDVEAGEAETATGGAAGGDATGGAAAGVAGSLHRNSGGFVATLQRLCLERWVQPSSQRWPIFATQPLLLYLTSVKKNEIKKRPLFWIKSEVFSNQVVRPTSQSKLKVLIEMWGGRDQRFHFSRLYLKCSLVKSLFATKIGPSSVETLLRTFDSQ